MKLLAIQIIGVGIYCEIKAGADIAIILITVGSLVFAIASNTTLFFFIKPKRNNRRDGDTDE